MVRPKKKGPYLLEIHIEVLVNEMTWFGICRDLFNNKAVGEVWRRREGRNETRLAICWWLLKMAIDTWSFVRFASTFAYVQTHTKFFKNNNNKVRICSFYLLLCISTLVEIECSIFLFTPGKHEFMSTWCRNHVAMATFHHIQWLQSQNGSRFSPGDDLSIGERNPFQRPLLATPISSKSLHPPPAIRDWGV